MRPDRTGERSVVTVLVCVLVVLAACAALLLGELGERSLREQRAQATADAVALAGVTGGRSAASEVAGANHAVLHAMEEDGVTVIARVRRAGIEATAAARPAPR